MKKLLIGIIIGIVLSIPTTIFASEIVSMIGKQVEGSFPLKINGIRAAKDVIVIEGTSYLPVRVAGELFGYDVSFIDDEVILNKNPKSVTEATYEINQADLKRISELTVIVMQKERGLKMDEDNLKSFLARKTKDMPEVTDYERLWAETNTDNKRALEEAKAELESLTAVVEARKAQPTP